MSATLHPGAAWPPLRRAAGPAAGAWPARGEAPAGVVSGIDDADLEPMLVHLDRHDGRLRRIGVTAAQAADGVTTLGVGLARLYARRGHAVALVDAEWRAPRLAAVFGLAGRPGFADVVAGEVAPMEAAHAVADNLTVVPAGRRAAIDAARLDDPNAAAFLGLVDARFDLAILDCPPVGRLGDTAALAALVDGFVMVIGAERTRRAVAARALADLEAVGGTALGAVLNRARRPIPRWLYRWLG